MQTEKRSPGFSQAELDVIMDELAAKRMAVMGHGRSLITGREWLQVKEEDGTVRQVPLN